MTSFKNGENANMILSMNNDNNNNDTGHGTFPVYEVIL